MNTRLDHQVLGGQDFVVPSSWSYLAPLDQDLVSKVLQDSTMVRLLHQFIWGIGTRGSMKNVYDS